MATENNKRGYHIGPGSRNNAYALDSGSETDQNEDVTVCIIEERRSSC